MGSVLFSPITALYENRSPGVVIIGSPGSGKTYAMQNIAANCFLTNQRVICLDGKNDMMALKKLNPDIHIVDINKISPGGLNPFDVLKDIDSSTLMSLIECMTGTLTNKQTIAIQPIIQDFINNYKRFGHAPTFQQVADYLYASQDEDARMIGTLLKINEDSKYGPLLFAENKDYGSKLAISDGSQIISLLGLDFPKTQDTTKLTAEQKFTSAIIYIITKKLYEILSIRADLPTVLFLDECHILFSNPSLSQVAEDFLVLGRSLKIATILATQNITHVPEDLSNQLSTKFIFKSDPKQAGEFLKRFDSSAASGSALDQESIISNIVNAGVGQCFMIDKLNRGGFLKFQSNLGITSNPFARKPKAEGA